MAQDFPASGTAPVISHHVSFNSSLSKDNTFMTNNTLWRISALALAGAITVGGLTACTINLPGSHSMAGMNHDGMMNDGDSDTDSSKSGAADEFSTTDTMFAQMMIPHHEQAVEMSTLAETRTTNTEVLALAASIKAAQSPEIEQMKAWLAAAGVNEMDGMDGMGHGGGDMGMLSEAQMTALSNAQGAQFDKLYLEGMIQHHRGAIDMAQMILSSRNPDVKLLGENIVSSQQAQIDQMETMLGSMQ